MFMVLYINHNFVLRFLTEINVHPLNGLVQIAENVSMNFSKDSLINFLKKKKRVTYVNNNFFFEKR